MPEHKSFPGADIGTDHNLLMMTFRLRLKTISKPKHTRLKFDLEKLKDPNVLESFQAMTGGRFAPLTIISNEDTDIDSMITTINMNAIIAPNVTPAYHSSRPRLSVPDRK